MFTAAVEKDRLLRRLRHTREISDDFVSVVAERLVEPLPERAAVMEAVTQQFQVLSEELGSLRNEIIALKQAHAGLHQGAVESGARTASLEKKLEEAMKGIETFGTTTGADRKRILIEAKQVEVPSFAGSIADSRNKFMVWSERFRDRVGLCDTKVV